MRPAIQTLSIFEIWEPSELGCNGNARHEYPGRKVVISPSEYTYDESAASWRTYDPTALVSLVLPVYNGTKYLSLSIESCLAQTHRNLELIVVDDGSVDNTPDIINRFSEVDTRIKHVRNEINLGLPESLNRGFQLATGRFMTWTSDDNLYTPTAIEYMVQQLCTYTEVGLVYCGMHCIDENGDKMAPLGFGPTRPPAELARRNVVLACFMYRREVMDAIGNYRPDYRYVEDYDFFIRASIRFPAKFYFEPCYLYRFHGGSLTSAHHQKYKVLIPESPPRALWIPAEPDHAAVGRPNRPEWVFNPCLMRSPASWACAAPSRRTAQSSGATVVTAISSRPQIDAESVPYCIDSYGRFLYRKPAGGLQKLPFGIRATYLGWTSE